MEEHSEELPIVDPEASDKSPVTEKTKEDLTTILDRWTLESKPLHASDDFPGFIDISHIPLTSEQDDTPVDIDLGSFANGDATNPNLRYLVAIERGNALGLIEEYMISENPDGWNVEYHERIDTGDAKAVKELVDYGNKDKAETIYRNREQSLQQSRELGITDVTEDQVKRLVKLLETAKTVE